MTFALNKPLLMTGCNEVTDNVRARVLQILPQAIYDDCIADKLQLSVRQHANHNTRELAGPATSSGERKYAAFTMAKKKRHSEGLKARPSHKDSNLKEAH
jgi:hypothetical protein